MASLCFPLNFAVNLKLLFKNCLNFKNLLMLNKGQFHVKMDRFITLMGY